MKNVARQARLDWQLELEQGLFSRLLVLLGIVPFLPDSLFIFRLLEKIVSSILLGTDAADINKAISPEHLS